MTFSNISILGRVNFVFSLKCLLIILIFFLAVPQSLGNRIPKQEKTESIVKNYKKKRIKKPQQKRDSSAILIIAFTLGIITVLSGFFIMMSGGLGLNITRWWWGLNIFLFGIILPFIILLFVPKKEQPTPRDFPLFIIALLVLILGVGALGVASIVYLIIGFIHANLWLWVPCLTILGITLIAIILGHILPHLND